MKFLSICVATVYLSAADLPKHVVILGYDGLSVAGFSQADAPAFHKLQNSGAYTLHARGVMPTVSSPNWASMIMGAGPEQHGILSNEWKLGQTEFTPTCSDEQGRFPTIFGLLRKQRPAAQIAIFHHWQDFARLVEPGAPTVIEHGQTAEETIDKAVDYLKTHKPDLLFVHLDSIDHAGHEMGHMTPDYQAAILEADALTARLLKALDMRDTVVLVTADHGGVGKKHGGNTMSELEIPWLVSGAGVRAGELKTPVNTFDTAATVAWLLRLQAPPCWIGRPVTEAFRE